MLLALIATVSARASGRPRHPRWPFRMELIVRYLRRDWEETAGWDLERLRQDMNQRPYPSNFARKVKTDRCLLGGVDVTRFTPPDALPGKHILFFHGGSFVFGSCNTTHKEFLARLACDSGLEVLGPEFRLAPPHSYPAQLEDARSVFDALVSDGVDAGDIFLAGDSSGGNLAIALQIALRDRGGPQARALVLSSPWVDLEMPGESFATHDRYDFGTREVLVRQARVFSGGLSLGDPRISPTNAVLEGLNPCLVVVGEVELPSDDILRFAERLEAAGVEVVVHVARDLPHNPPVFASVHSEGREAFAVMARFIRARCDDAGTSTSNPTQPSTPLRRQAGLAS